MAIHIQSALIETKERTCRELSIYDSVLNESQRTMSDWKEWDTFPHNELLHLDIPIYVQVCVHKNNQLNSPILFYLQASSIMQLHQWSEYCMHFYLLSSRLLNCQWLTLDPHQLYCWYKSKERKRAEPDWEEGIGSSVDDCFPPSNNFVLSLPQTSLKVIMTCPTSNVP